MGASRTAPDPKFEENLKEIGNLPEDKRGMAFATTLLTGGSGVNSIMGRASGGASMLDTPGGFSGIIKPSASATIKAPEPTPELKADPNMQMFVGSDLADKAEFSKKTGLTEVDPRTEKRIKDLEEVKDDLLAKAKERRSKTQEVKEEAMSAMSIPSGLSQFGIQNYRAGGAKFDRDDTKSVGDDMDTGKPSPSQRAKSFLGNLTGKGGFGVRIESQ